MADTEQKRLWAQARNAAKDLPVEIDVAKRFDDLVRNSNFGQMLGSIYQEVKDLLPSEAAGVTCATREPTYVKARPRPVNFARLAFWKL
jgi:hypothetical protein